MGTSLRSDLDNIHRREMQVFEKSQVEAVKEMNERHQEVHVFPFCILVNKDYSHLCSDLCSYNFLFIITTI